MEAELLTSVDRNWSYGMRVLKDFDKRLRNALRDAKFTTVNVDAYINYLGNLIQYLEKENVDVGIEDAIALYRLRRN